MRGGKLRETVVIQVSAAASADTYGGQEEGWSDVASVRAHVKQLGGAESWKQKTVRPDASHEVTIRYTPNMTHERRLKWGARYLYPTDVIVDERNRMMRCLCREQL